MNAEWSEDDRATSDGKAEAETLVVDVGGFEGPLDLLLSLAREQKVDLTRISILSLAQQYLAFVEQARRLSLELAADYLVMAAWLAYLKSRLLLPEKVHDDEPGAEELAAALALRLRRLEAMRRAGDDLLARARLGVDVFPRGEPQIVSTNIETEFQASLYDLLHAYAAHRSRKAVRWIQLAGREVFSLAEARARLQRFVGGSVHWTSMDSFLVEYLAKPEMRASARASLLSASLEMAREGGIELRQAAPFAPLYLRRKPAQGPVDILRG